MKKNIKWVRLAHCKSRLNHSRKGVDRDRFNHYQAEKEEDLIDEVAEIKLCSMRLLKEIQKLMARIINRR